MRKPYRISTIFYYKAITKGGNMGRFIDLTGQRFGRLVVLERTGSDSRGEALWRCQCDCGNVIDVLSSNLRAKNHTLSCGCYRRENLQTVNKTHGMTGTPIYTIWCAMKRRCHQQHCLDYKNYGGRGITVCNEWHYNFKAFYDWALASGYKPGLSIDRKDTNGNYNPDNCRWVTAIQQANNKRCNRLLTYGGETHTMKEWSRITGINYNTLHSRVRRGLPDEEVLNGQSKSTDRKEIKQA